MQSEMVVKHVYDFLKITLANKRQKIQGIKSVLIHHFVKTRKVSSVVHSDFCVTLTIQVESQEPTVEERTHS